MTSHRIGAWLLVMWLGVLAGCASQSDERPTINVDAIADALRNSADPRYGPPRDELSRRAIIDNMAAILWGNGHQHLARWESEIRMVVGPTDDDLIHDSIANFLRTLRKAATLPPMQVTYVEESAIAQGDETNFRISFLPSEAIAALAEDAVRIPEVPKDEVPCVSRPSVDANGEIMSADVDILDTIDFTEKRKCFVLLMMRSLGFNNIHLGEGYTFFQIPSRYETLTRLDEIMLQILYNPRMQAGMDMETGLAVAAEILDELGVMD